MKKGVVILLVFSIILWSCVDVIIVAVVPGFVGMFTDVRDQLPVLTRACFRLSYLAHLYYPLIEPLFIGTLVAISISIARKEQKRVAVLFCISGATAVLALVIMLFLPIFYKFK